MRSTMALCALLTGVAISLTGCSFSGGTPTFWNPFASKNKSSASTSALASAPSSSGTSASTAPLAPPSVSIPGGNQTAAGYPNYANASYPVTPYPAATVAQPGATGYPASPAMPAPASYSGYAPVAGPMNGQYAPPANSQYTAAQPYGAAATSPAQYTEPVPGTVVR